uniref:Uncharacterized protein n=1 Tax=Papio anubis TaxID=9555 RepID=A0A8I5NSI2_PAPAN
MVNPKDEEPVSLVTPELPYQPWAPPSILPSYGKDIFLYHVRCLLQPNTIPTDTHRK